MQNIPGVTSTNEQTQLPTSTTYKVDEGDKQSLFAELFDSHTSLLHEEMAMAPVTSKDSLAEKGPEISEKNSDQGQAGESVATKGKTREKKEVGVPAEQARVSEEELDSVSEDLKEYGFTDEEIKELKEQAASEKGLTWGQLMRKAAQKMHDMKLDLSDEDKEKVLSFLDKLGFSEKQAEKLLKQLEDGDYAKVVQAIQEQLATLDPAKTIEFTSDEIKAVTSALPFTKEFTAQLKELLGAKKTVADLKDVFSSVKDELADMDAKDRKLVKALGKALAAAVGETKGKELLESTVAKELKAPVDLKGRAAAEQAQAEARESFKESMQERKFGDGAKTMDQAENAAEVLDAKDHKFDESGKSWEKFDNKLLIKNPTRGAETAMTKTMDQTAQLLNAATATKTETQSAAWQKVTAPKLVRQVQNALLTNLSNGTKQLQLQLEPAELGKLHITLQVHNKDVNAVIRAENGDAAKMIADQMDSIKSQLEAQGLKVSKLDVQTSTPEQFNQDAWQGQNNHNMARERSALAQMRSRMRMLRGQDAELAAQVPTTARQGLAQGQGLHLIA